MYPAGGYSANPESGLFPGSFDITADAATITFTNDSSFTPVISNGSANQAIGRFQLTGSTSGVSLTAASIKLNNTRSGLSNFKLWSSSNATFESGSDTQLGSKISSDPGVGASASFSSFSSSISTSGTYYFLTVDLASSTSGSVQGAIVNNASLTISSGTLSGTISNAALSSSSTTLPVELSSFNANTEDNTVVLHWTT
ncbi:hypothetical protein JW960_16095 [candidate division KSB1 bacterium]|nr:hypothetical protein [candidate division KSB1 bacterium]